MTYGAGRVMAGLGEAGHGLARQGIEMSKDGAQPKPPINDQPVKNPPPTKPITPIPPPQKPKGKQI